jgi:hypothetical protein
MKVLAPYLVVFAGIVQGEVEVARGFGEVPSSEELERAAVQYRVQHIKRGSVRMHVTDSGRMNNERLYEITFDEKRIRQVLRSRPPGAPDWGKADKIVVTPDNYIMDDEASPTPVAVYLGSSKDYVSPRQHLRALNIQALGMHTSGVNNLHSTHLESILNRSDRTNPVVRLDPQGGVEAWRIDFSKTPKQDGVNTEISCWIAPRQGYGVIRIEARSNHSGRKATGVLECKLKQYPNDNVWFPSKMTRTVTMDGAVTARQVATVEEATFGGEVDEKAFSLTGLGLEPGREVLDASSGQAWGKVWNGDEAVFPSKVRTSSVKEERRPLLLWGLAVGLALAAIFYFRRIIRHRRSSAGAAD